MKKVLDSIRKHWPIIIHYGHGVILSLGTIVFGILLLINNRNNVIERVDLFPQQTSLYFGMVMMFFGSATTGLAHYSISSEFNINSRPSTTFTFVEEHDKQLNIGSLICCFIPQSAH